RQAVQPPLGGAVRLPPPQERRLAGQPQLPREPADVLHRLLALKVVAVAGVQGSPAARQSRIAMMYHALHEGQVPAGEDPHYTLSRTTFERQMRQIAEAPGGCSMRDHLGDVSRARVVVTFDDGHVSNHA